MPLPLDSYFLLWLIGIWQPISPNELAQIISQNFREQFESSEEKEISRLCQKYVKAGLLVRVYRKPSMYSLSQKGNVAIPKKLRHSRDKTRLFLFRDINRGSLRGSHDEVFNELSDATSLMQTRFKAQRSEARSFASFVPTGQTFWPRFFQQFFKTGNTPSSCDIRYPLLLSYYRVQQLSVAKQVRLDDPNYINTLKIDELNLALMMGISHQLISSILKNKRHYYQSFTFPKKTGGVREVNAPRVFLKVIQRFLLDYYLGSLKVHSSVTSFRNGKSVIDNAYLHKAQNYVGSIDIENFFGSITLKMITKLLIDNGYDESEASLIAGLCTLRDVLPQGAPTSPILSNALLYEFDQYMNNITTQWGLTYSRYADDLTISGDNKEAVKEALREVEQLLKDIYSLKINENKTRVVSQNNRQVVTGLVVNEKVQPPKYKRRQIRAAFHKASLQKQITDEDFNQLRGYYGYLFAIYRNHGADTNGTKTMLEYSEILKKLSKKIIVSP